MGETPASLAGAGLLLGAASLVRPIGYWLMPFLLILLAWRHWRKWMIFAVGFLLAVLPWQVRNAAVFHTFSFSGISDLNLMAYRAAGVLAILHDTNVDDETNRVIGSIDYTQSPAVIAAKLRHDAVAVLLPHPIAAARMTVESIVRTAFGPGKQSISLSLGMDLNRFEGALLAIWAAAIWIAAGLGVWRSGFGEKTVILFAVAGYMILASAGPEGYSRMRIPAMPALAAMVGVPAAKRERGRAAICSSSR